MEQKSEMTKALLGEVVLTNDRSINYALRQAAELLNRRDIAPQAKLDMLFAYLLKVRRDLLGRID